jgi:hypothetical protein
LSDYNHVLWISDIPREPKYCYVKVWGIEDENVDAWVEVRKFQEPQIPNVPDICKQWVKIEKLSDINVVPVLEKSICVGVEKKDSVTGTKEATSETLLLQDHPEIQKEWDRYLKDAWSAWKELYIRYSSVKKVYSKLFQIHQDILKMGEQLELVICFGLLTWKDPSGQTVRRHLITAKVSLEFESNLGVFKIGPPNDGNQVEVELDMLDITVQPQNTKRLIEDGRNALKTNIWDRTSLDCVLNTIVNSLAENGQGEYRNEQVEPGVVSATSKPIVEYAPALILRKRSAKGLEIMLAKIKEQVKSGVEVPNAFLDLCESLNETKDSGADDLQIVDSKSSDITESPEIYFPLLANDEQRRIINANNQQDGVLVQGPPGTGKSHTIANLICHLLATGKKVLVTAKTSRALRVLNDKLPKEISPLCISLLGSSVEERKSLEKSVDGILKKIDGKGLNIEKNKILDYEKQLNEERKELATVDNKLLSLREKETFEHVIADSAYVGTAAKIAREIQSQEMECAWFADEIDSNAMFPLTNSEIEDLIMNLNERTQEDENLLLSEIPDLETELPEVKNIKEILQEGEATHEILTTYASMLDESESHAIANADNVLVGELIGWLKEYLVVFDAVNKRPMTWMSKAIYDVLTDNDTPWKELNKYSLLHLAKIRELAPKVDTCELQLALNVDSKTLLANAIAVKSHLSSGGKIGFWIFKSKVMREQGSFLTKAKIDGVACLNIETIQKLIDYLNVKNELEYLWSLWKGKVEKQSDSFLLQVAEIDELHEALSSVLNLYEIRERTKATLKKIPGLNNPSWENVESCQKLVERAGRVLWKKKHKGVFDIIDRIDTKLSEMNSRPNTNPVMGELLYAFRNKKCELCLEKLND